MRLRVHHPLFAGFLGVVGLLVLLIVVLVGNTLERELRLVHQDALARELRLGADLLATSPEAVPVSVVARMALGLGYRVTLIDSTGTVFADSEVAGALPPEGSHAARPEVVGAWQEGLGFGERESATVGLRFLYGAMPVAVGGRTVVLRFAMPLSDVDATVRRAQGAFALAGAAAMALALVVAYLLSRAFTQPLVMLAERARTLAAGDFTRRVPRNTRVAELDELAVGFNRLADELDQRMAELARERDEMHVLIDTMAEGVVALTADQRVLRVNHAARALLGVPRPAPMAPLGTLVRHPELRALLEESVRHSVDAREVRVGERHFIASSRLLDRGGSVTTFLDVSEIRRLEQVRRDFVANVSHELKTPLTSIRGFAETLLEDDPPQPLRHQFLDLVRRNTLRLQRLVDDLLDLSRLESGGWRAEPEPLDLALAAREAWQPFDAGARQKGVDFRIDGTALASADVQGISQVFQNLFDNALRYTPEGGRIAVAIREAGEGVHVAVTDTGGGIPARDLPRIFERFYRVDPARGRDAGGTGLGLAIVRHLLQSMGGDVSADSELGGGTTIRFTLPQAGPEGGPEEE